MTSVRNSAPRLLPLRMPRVCVAVACPTAAEMISRAEGIVRDNSFIEFRLDYLKDPGLFFPRLRKLVTERPEIVAIGTCRRAANGGKFHGSVARQIDLLVKAAAAGCQMVDIELQSVMSLKKGELEKLRTKAVVLLSYHDFKATRKLDDIFGKMAAFPADYYKLVTKANSLVDNVHMLKFLETHGDRQPVVGFCMGEAGLVSRILCLRAGSMFTYAAVGAGEETAAGQLPLKTLREVYRIEQVDVATKVYGVAGDPIAYSHSPAMLNAAFRRENVNAAYVPLQTKSVKDLITCVREVPISGLSITMPLKQALVDELDNVETLASKIGAVNTLIRAQDAKLYGFNTDVAGVIRPLEHRITLQGAKVLVIGAGGAARAAVFGLRERGAEVWIMNRTAAKAQKLARQAKAKSLKRADLKKYQFDVIINATPVGMAGNDSPLNEKELNARYVFDMVYFPIETKLLAMAKAKGLHTIPGSEMLVQQGARQFEIWTGKPAPVDEMNRAVYYALQTAAGNGKKK